MKRFVYLLAGLVAVSVATAFADTLELADGTLIEGKLVGTSNGIVMFNTGEDIEAYPEANVVGIFLSGGVATREAKTGAAASPAASGVTIPSGTRMVLRMVEGIDTRRHQVGHRFRAQLEGAMVVDGITAVPRGAFVYGRITQARQSGRAVGSSEMAIEFTDIMIDDALYEIATEGMQAKTGNEAANTVGRTARAAAIGALISGKSGAKTGAAVGAGASLLIGGTSINVPAGTILETRLRVPVTVPISG